MVSTLMLKDTSDRTAFKVFEPGGTADLPGFGLRQQPDAAGRPGQLQAAAVDARQRLGALPALVPGRHAGELDTRRVLQRRWAAGDAGLRHEVRAGGRVPHLPH
jgi:glutamine synthetase